MRYLASFASMVVVVIFIFALLGVYEYEKKTERDFYQVYLQKVVDNATKTAFQSALSSGDLGISYTDLETVKIDPVNTIKMFKTSMLLSLNYALSDANMEMLDNYITGGVFVTGNGYYVLDIHPVRIGGATTTELKWGLKKPYSIHYPSGASVAYNLSSESWVLLKPNGSNFTVFSGEGYGKLYRDHGVTVDKTQIYETVNRRITNDVNAVLTKRANLLGKDTVTDRVFLPSISPTVDGTNPVLKPSLLLAIGGVDFLGTQKLTRQTVGGYTMSKKVRLIGFEEGGVKYYSFEGKIPNHILASATHFFNSSEEAAQAGYKPHLKYILGE